MASLGLGLASWALWPSHITTVDEAGYSLYAESIRRGRLAYASHPFLPGKFTTQGPHGPVPVQPPGNSFLVPFPDKPTLSLGRGLLCQILMALLGYLLGGALASVLVALHPTLLLYARTLLPDVPAALLVLLSFYLWKKERGFLAGLALGFLGLLRYQGLGLILGFGLGALVFARERAKPLLLGLLPGLLLTGAWLLWAYGGPPPVSGPYSPAHLPSTILWYGLCLLLVYPGMLFGLIRVERPWLFGVLGYMLVILPFGRIDTAGWPGTLISGARMLVAILPIVILGYVELVKKIPFVWLMGPLLVVSSWLVAHKHRERVRIYAQGARLLGRVVPRGSVITGNREVIRLLGPWNRLYYHEARGDYIAYFGYPRPNPQEEAKLRARCRKIVIDTILGGERFLVGRP